MDEDSILRHKDERKVRGVDEDAMSVTESVLTDDPNDVIDEEENSDSEEDGEDTDSSSRSDLQDIKEEPEQSVDAVSEDVNKMDIAAAAAADVEEEEVEEEDEALFPDTNIELHHVKGDKWVRTLVIVLPV